MALYIFDPLITVADQCVRLYVSKEVTTMKLVRSAVTNLERLWYFGQTQET